MDKFWNSRIFRVLICLILVCCILVNASPIRAKAVTPVALTGWAILALTAALGAGIVLNPATPQVANAIGEEFKQKVGDISVSFHPELLEKVKKLSDHLDNMTPEWDSGDFHNDLKTALAGGLLTAITAMTVAAVADGVVNTEVEEIAPDGYQYYDDYLSYELPDSDILTSHPCLIFAGNSLYCYSSAPIIESESSSFYYFKNDSDGVIYSYVFHCDHSDLKGWCNPCSGEQSDRIGAVWGIQKPLRWSNFDLKNSDGSKTYFEASEPSSTSTITVPVVPEIYVGDIPQKIQDGEEDPDELNIPIIDPTKVVTSPDTAFQEITQVVQNIKDGTTTYNEFVTNNEYQAPAPDTPDPSTPPDTSDPTEGTEPDEGEEEKPSEELGNFTLDLSDYFPFCIPFDLYDFFACLAASPEAPVIHWEIVGPGGSSHELNLDLSPYDSVAQLLRRLQLLLFCVGLAFKTRDLIKG